jgi:hypothetical protein
MKRFRVPVITTLIVGGLFAAFVSVTSANAGESTAAPHTVKLLVKYDTSSKCTVYPNYPKKGVIGNGKTFAVPAGRKRIIWRYNVNKDWAVVSDPLRAKHKTYPWWGFTQRNCIKNEPALIRQGRSQKGAKETGRASWRTVRFSMPPAPVTAKHQLVKHNAMLRDPANFVVGNVPSGWHVDLTAKSRSNGAWVYVYVPNAKRWGYIERAKLS